MRRVIVILLLLLLIFSLTRPILIVENREEEVLLLLPLLWNRTFTTVYTHSVEKTPVYEFFRIKGQKIILEKTLFSSYGAGLPLDEDGFTREGGSFAVQRKETFSTIYFRVSTTPDQFLLIGEGEREIYFQDLLPPGGRLSIRGAPLYVLSLEYLQRIFTE